MDLQAQLSEQIRAAAHARRALQICGNGSKSFYGRSTSGTALQVAAHRGITAYTPAELVISARAGTTLAELEAVLAEQRQMLAFEPPHYAAGATLGGAIASGLSGPRRPFAGAARDFVLGVNCLNGRGEALRFGGQVMKNVAGYDLSRLLTGSLGTLAVLLEIHLKVLPMPELEVTQYLECDAGRGIRLCNEWIGKAMPISAASHFEGQLLLRLSGTRAGVAAAVQRIGGETLDDSNRFWQQMREQRLPFFSTSRPLWRISVPPNTPVLPGDNWLYDWGGALRWYADGLNETELRALASRAGGHATLFRNGDREGEVFQPLPAALLEVHRRLKQAFDPAGILNPGRMYAGL